MAETLGSLCDKLTIVKLKQWHTTDANKSESLKVQERQLITEVDEYIEAAIHGNISKDRLTFPSNKVYKNTNSLLTNIKIDSLGIIFSQLAEANCELWHEQEKVFEFENVPVAQKDQVVKQLAILNLKRNRCIDEIDRQFASMVTIHTEKLSESV